MQNTHVERNYITLLRKDGKLYRSSAGVAARIKELEDGAERRHGEQIVGTVCTHQAGVHNVHNTFGKIADEIRIAQNIIRKQTFGVGTTRGYYENCIARLKRDAIALSVLSDGSKLKMRNRIQ